jgi:hypothetical protein
VYSPALGLNRDDCPRCRAKLGRVSRLFRSALPPRLREATRSAEDVVREPVTRADRAG